MYFKFKICLTVYTGETKINDTYLFIQNGGGGGGGGGGTGYPPGPLLHPPLSLPLWRIVSVTHLTYKVSNAFLAAYFQSLQHFDFLYGLGAYATEVMLSISLLSLLEARLTFSTNVQPVDEKQKSICTFFAIRMVISQNVSC